MKVPRSGINVDRVVLIAMILALAAFGIMAVSINDEPVSPPVQSVTSAAKSSPAAGTSPVHADDAKLVASKPASAWAADESAQGTQPDAAH